MPGKWNAPKKSQSRSGLNVQGDNPRSFLGAMLSFLREAGIN
jgi:hypothetical protein